MATIAEALAIAVGHHQAGRLDVAERIYRQILAAEPNQPNALHLLGVIAHQVGNPGAAVEFIKQAIQLNGNVAVFHVNLGRACQAQGKTEEAVACFRRALELEPGDAATQIDLGDALRTQGKPEQAIACYRTALELDPSPELHNNLGNLYQGLGKLEEAAACYRRALELNPKYAEPYNNLGNLFQGQGKLLEAIDCCRRAFELKPDFAEAQVNLGNALRVQGELDQAVACYRRALELKPRFAVALLNLGNALQGQGKLDEAIAAYRQALEAKPDNVDALNNLGTALKGQGKFEEAIDCYRRALALRPDFPAALLNFGSAHQAQGNLEEAIGCYRRTLELQPDFAAARNNLGNALKDQGNVDEAVLCFRRAVEIKPDFAAAHSNLLYALNFCPDYDARSIYEEHRRWNERHAEPLAKLAQPHPNDRSTDRRLRVGYVSPDFCNHVVGLFLLPLLESHDHQGFEIYCYSSTRAADAVTDRCAAEADAWRNVFGVSDEQLAQTIRQDRIDILVDLSMHTANNRLLTFARKPAPVQVTYLAYAGTTGLSSMGYRLTDPYLDPPGPDAIIYCEESVRLPETYWCYRPLEETPPVNPLPALQAGQVTFGCLNNLCKVSAPTLTAWSELLGAMPRAKLLLHAHAGKHRDHLRNFFARRGVSPARIEFAEMLPKAEYFQLYHRIDVALDPFPFGGGTTTCDALWMGVPVVSLAGQTAAGRGGLSILSNVRLADLVAYDSEQYVRNAVELAEDVTRLGHLRATLRERMQNSSLMDAPRFARNVETAYRAMWRRWCNV